MIDLGVVINGDRSENLLIRKEEANVKCFLCVYVICKNVIFLKTHRKCSCFKKITKRTKIVIVSTTKSDKNKNKICQESFEMQSKIKTCVEILFYLHSNNGVNEKQHAYQ